MVNIIFEAHATSLDNEANVSSGWYDAKLSELGKSQAEELGERYKNEHIDAVFCSDLKRSSTTADIAFAARKIPIISDERLRECHYGDFTRHPNVEVEALKSGYIRIPFPNGESYEQTADRMKSFLRDLSKNYNGKQIMIIGHRATQYGLELWINNVPLSKSVITPFKWRPGWRYTLYGNR